MIRYDEHGYPQNVVAPVGKILDMREAHLLQLADTRLTRDKLLQMKPKEINTRWSEIQSFLAKEGK